MNVIDANQSHWSDILHRGGPEDNGSEKIPVDPDLDNASEGRMFVACKPFPVWPVGKGFK